MKRYWLVLNPDTFIWIKDKEGLIYNAANYAKLHFDHTGKVAELVAVLQDIDSLYRVSVAGEVLDTEPVKRWIDSIVGSASGRLVEDDGNGRRPVSLKPVVKVQDGAEYYRWEHGQGIEGNVIHNLHKLTFHINGSAGGNARYVRQFAYPVRTHARLDKDLVVEYIRNAGRSDLLSEIVLVGDPAGYPGMTELLRGVAGCGYPVTCCCLIDDFCLYCRDTPETAFAGVSYRLLVPGGVLPGDAADYCDRPDVEYDWVVTSEAEYAAAAGLLEKYAGAQARILPAYNGENLDFFKEYVYTDREQLDGSEVSKREIFIRQTLNVFSFGHLTVSAEGLVYAGPDGDALGHIGESPCRSVYREMTQGASWLRVRREEPCSRCIYQWLCPSPSGYESATGIPNLCHIR